MANKNHRFKHLLNGLKSDVALLARFGKGDASAFESLYERYKDQVFNHLCDQLGSLGNKQTIAEEIAQEVWTAVIRGADRFQDRSGNENSSFRSWLFSIVHRRVADFWRSQYKQPDTESAEFDADQVAEESSNLEQARLIQELMRGIDELPVEQRQSFLLREEGFSYREIAAITETNEETVKSRLRYAKKILQEKLNNDETPNKQANKMEHQYD